MYVIVQFWIHQDRWIKRQKTHLFRASLNLKLNVHKYQREDELFTTLCIVLFSFVFLSSGLSEFETGLFQGCLQICVVLLKCLISILLLRKVDNRY